MAAIKYLWDVDTIDASDTTRFGGKAGGLARMRQMGLPVPPAVVISTDAFKAFHENGGQLPASLGDEIDTAIHLLEQRTGKDFCGRGVPLLLSVRSGAKISMPGMMDTILNLGLDAASAASFSTSSGNHAFVGDTWLRFWSMYADTVLGVDAESIVPRFEEAIAASNRPVTETFAAIETELLSAIESEAGERPSASPREQLARAVTAVFESWNSSRAKAYRKHHGIPDDLGTAVVIQAMVFGNLDDESGTGVAFTRDPMTGERKLFGEYLAGHQEKIWSPVRRHLIRSAIRHLPSPALPTRSAWSAINWRRYTRMRSTLNSRWNEASCICSRCVQPSAPPPRQSGSRLTWRRRASLVMRRRCAG